MKQRIKIVPNILFGSGILTKLDEVLKKNNVRKLLLFVDELTTITSVFEQVLSNIDPLKYRIEIISLKDQELTWENVTGLRQKINRDTFDMYIGIGRKSVLNITKAAALQTFYPEIPLYVASNDSIIHNKIPTILIPTTIETSQQSFLTIRENDESDKTQFFTHHYLMPDYILLDPLLLTFNPPTIIAASCVNSLSYAFEVYLTQRISRWVNAACLHAIKLITSFSIRAVFQSNNVQAQEAIAKGGLLADLSLSRQKMRLFHYFLMPIENNYHVSKDLTTAILLPHFIDYFINKVSDMKKIKLYESLQIEKSKGETIINKFQKLFSGMGFPTDFSSIGISIDNISELAEEAFTFWRYHHEKEPPIEQQLFYNLYSRAIN